MYTYVCMDVRMCVCMHILIRLARLLFQLVTWCVNLVNLALLVIQINVDKDFIL